MISNHRNSNDIKPINNGLVINFTPIACKTSEIILNVLTSKIIANYYYKYMYNLLQVPRTPRERWHD